MVKIIAAPFTVTHLSENPSVCGGNALHCHIGVVRIEADIRCRITFQIDILRCDLTVLDQLKKDGCTITSDEQNVAESENAEDKETAENATEPEAEKTEE